MSRTRIDPSLLNNLSSNLNMGSNKIVSLANGTASTDAAAFGQIKVLQTVTATGTTTTTTTSTTTVQTVVTASITPTSSSNRILIIASTTLIANNAANINEVGVMRGSTELTAGELCYGQITGLNTGGVARFPVTISWVDSPATTSATSYYMSLANVTGNSVSLGGNGIGSWSIVLMEVV